jgi:hypothetical protein
VLRASAGNTDVHPHAALRSASLAWGYENSSLPGLLNGKLKMEKGEWAGASATLQKKFFKNSCK